MGMQIFEVFAGLPERHDTDQITVNTGEGDDPSFHNRLYDLFETNLNIHERLGFEKQKSWRPDAIDTMFKNRKKCLSVLRLKPSPHVEMEKVVHVRGKDKMVASPAAIRQKVLEFSKDGDIHILSDDVKMSGALSMHLELYGVKHSVSEQSDVEDWHSILYADKVLGVLSTFTLSTLLVNPDKDITLFGKEYNDGSYSLSDEDYEAAERILHWCPNVRWI
jgi:hypothetical protein